MKLMAVIVGALILWRLWEVRKRIKRKMETEE